jgi:transposase
MDEQPSIFIGIDVSKDRLDVHLRPTDEAFHVARDAKGLEALTRRFGNLPVALVVLEATGGFEANVAAALAAAGLPLCIVNPRQIRDFARAMGRLAKTDALDAEVIALFAERIRPPARPLPEPERSHFAELVSRRRQIIGMINMETNRRDQAVDKQLMRRLSRHIAFLEKELSELDGDIGRTSRHLRSGARPRRCSSPFLGSATSPRARFWLSCLNSAPSAATSLPLSSASLRSTATLA